MGVGAGVDDGREEAARVWNAGAHAGAVVFGDVRPVRRWHYCYWCWWLLLLLMLLMMLTMLTMLMLLWRQSAR
jgi:hypothetical protein